MLMTLRILLSAHHRGRRPPWQMDRDVRQ